LKLAHLSATKVPIIIIIVGVAVILGVIIYMIKANSSTSDIVLSMIKSVFFYLQTVSILLSRTSLQWPNSLISLQGIFTFTNISLSVFSCIDVNIFGSTGGFFVLIVAPFLVLTATLLMVIIFYIHGYLTKVL